MRSRDRTAGRTFLEEARRAQIIDCAIQALGDDGYGAATMANIAARAKVSKSVIAYHFGSKDQLFGEVVAAVFAAATADLRPRLDAETTASGRLKAYIEGRVGFLKTHRSHMLALFEIWTNLRDSSGRLQFGETDANATVDAIVQLLLAGQRSDEFGDFDAEVTAMAIRQAIDGVLLQLRSRPDLDIDRYAAGLVTLFERTTSPSEKGPRK